MVRNQAEAIEFFTGLGLGFYQHSDDPLGENTRWVTLGLEKQPDFQIILQSTEWGPGGETPAEREAFVGKGGGFIFETDDCKVDVERLRALGVKIVLEPSEYPWGIQAMFADLYGNIYSLSEPPRQR